MIAIIDTIHLYKIYVLYIYLYTCVIRQILGLSKIGRTKKYFCKFDGTSIHIRVYAHTCYGNLTDYHIHVSIISSIIFIFNFLSPCLATSSLYLYYLTEYELWRFLGTIMPTLFHRRIFLQQYWVV